MFYAKHPKIRTLTQSCPCLQHGESHGDLNLLWMEINLKYSSSKYIHNVLHNFELSDISKTQGPYNNELGKPYLVTETPLYLE